MRRKCRSCVSKTGCTGLALTITGFLFIALSCPGWLFIALIGGVFCAVGAVLLVMGILR